MAHVLSVLSPKSSPQQGEKVALVRMSVHPQQGWRISAASEQGRMIGRWVSECARTITDMSFSWLSGFGWEIAEHPETTHSFADAFDKAELAPDQPADANMVFGVLIQNYVLVGKPQAPEARQSRMIAGPVQGRAPMIRRRDESQQQVTPRATHQEPPQAQVAGTPGARSRKEVDTFLGDASKALKKGGAPDAVQLYMLQYFFEGRNVAPSATPEAMEMAKFVRGLRQGLRDGWKYEDVQRSVLASLSVVEVAEQPKPTAPGRQLRPLMPGEDLDALGLTDEQKAAIEQLGPEDPGLRKKVEQTLELQRQAMAAAGPLKPAQVHAHLQHQTAEETADQIRVERERIAERKLRREQADLARAEAERLEAELAAEGDDDLDDDLEAMEAELGIDPNPTIPVPAPQVQPIPESPVERTITSTQDGAQPTNGGGQPVVPPSPYNKRMNKPELMAAAQAAGLSVEGTKDQILARLEAQDD